MNVFGSLVALSNLGRIILRKFNTLPRLDLVAALTLMLTHNHVAPEVVNISFSHSVLHLQSVIKSRTAKAAIFISFRAVWQISIKHVNGKLKLYCTTSPMSRTRMHQISKCTNDNKLYI